MPTDSPLTHTLLMVEPERFALNLETAANNAFQEIAINAEFSDKEIAGEAHREFWDLVNTLRQAEIQVVVCQSRKGILNPDSLFPNNWVSFHPERVVLYPMMAQNRRTERQIVEVIDQLTDGGVSVSKEILDLSPYEDQNQFLEGTGSLVLDRHNRLAYAALSARTTQKLIEHFCQEMEYRAITFSSTDKNDQVIYHTNVMMSVGKDFSVVCLQSIKDQAEKKKVHQSLIETNHEVIEISFEQLHSFAGNILHVVNIHNQSKIVMSLSAYTAFTARQKQQLQKYGELIFADLSIIERCGGGSARCMLTEVFTV